MRRRIFLTLLIFILIYPSSLIAATEQRIALVIGNSAYSSGPLKNPVNDATDMAAALKRAGFKVTLKRNANLQEMVETIEAFGNSLKRGGVGLFYYAGHGVQVNSVNYLLPIGARINKESDVRFQAIDAGRVLAEMENANNSLNIVILDACRDNPFGKSFRSASRGLAIVTNAPSGTLISYSTGAGQVANDGEGKNSPYTRALLENISKPGLTINKVFMNVRSRVKRETGQVPWELSSLEGDFYFIPGSAKTLTDGELIDSKTSPKDQMERELLEQKKALTEEKRKLEEERKQLAMDKRPSLPTSGETDRDGRFIAYENGTVLDSKSNLMWAAKGNKNSLDWEGAKSYCDNYRGGGYMDWRMPTKDELAGLYEPGRTMRWKVTTLIDVPDDCWANETRSNEAAHFAFINGGQGWHHQNILSVGSAMGALPVRSLEIKKDSRFIDNGNGTILDTKTSLMWAARDNGEGIHWPKAKNYCENYFLAGYRDWRLPTTDELAGLYDNNKRYKAQGRFPVNLTELIKLSNCSAWTSDTRGSDAAYFDYCNGNQGWYHRSYFVNPVLPVRSFK